MRPMAAPSRAFSSDLWRCQYGFTTLDSGAAVYAFTGFPQHYVCPY